MPNYVAVSKQTHKNHKLLPSDNFLFAAKDALCPLSMQETPTAVLHLPIAFCQVGEHFDLFAVQSLEAGSNYLVDEQGHWQGGYLPAAYRSYPFALRLAEDNKQVLCVDSESSLIGGKKGKAFFKKNGEPSKEIQETLEFLSQAEAFRQSTLAMCTFLQELDLLEAWPINIENNGETFPLTGLFRINEAKLTSLSNKALGSLRDKGALPLIYSQLLSMQNMTRLSQLRV